MVDMATRPTWEKKDRNNGQAELEIALPYMQCVTESVLREDGAGYARKLTESYTPAEREDLLAALYTFSRSVDLLLHGVAGLVALDKIAEQVESD